MRRLAESDAPGPLCCGAPMTKRITAPMVSVAAFDNYRCPMTGEVVQSFRRRKYLMEQNNVVDARDFEGHWKRTQAKRDAERAGQPRLAAAGIAKDHHAAHDGLLGPWL